MEKQVKIKISALWEKTSKTGDKYFTGKLGDASIIIYKNGYKKEDKHPDWIVYLQEPQKKESQQQSSSEEIPF